MINIIEKIRNKRFLFMRKLYELYESDQCKHINVGEIAILLGYSDNDFEEVKKIIDYLEGEKLIKVIDRIRGGFPTWISISHVGIVETEKALNNPIKSTDYFPPIVNIMNIATANESIFQLGTVNSTQNIKNKLEENMGDKIIIKAKGDVAFGKDKAIVKIIKTIQKSEATEKLKVKLEELTSAVESMIKQILKRRQMKQKTILKDLLMKPPVKSRKDP